MANNWQPVARPDLRQRSYAEEWMDQPNISTVQMHGVMRELVVINQLLGGYAATFAGLKPILKASKPGETITIADIGCGGGDTLLQVAQWANKQGLKLKLIGVDLSQDAIAYAQQHVHDSIASIYPVEWVVMDYRNWLASGPQVDILMTSLFFHHLKDEQIVEALQYMQRYAKLGWVINDLHRHWFAYQSIRLLTHFLSRSPLVKYDSSLSVWRGFVKQDWLSLLQQAKGNAHIQWIWAFRWVVWAKTN